MAEFRKEHLNAIQSAALDLVLASIEHSKNIRAVVAPNGFPDAKVICDYNRIALTLPQRSGCSMFGQFLAEELMELFPESNIIRFARDELYYGDAIDPRIDFMRVTSMGDFGRARLAIRESKKNYNFIIIDDSEYVCVKDFRFVRLAEAMHRQSEKDQFIINLSTSSN